MQKRKNTENTEKRENLIILVIINVRSTYSTEKGTHDEPLYIKKKKSMILSSMFEK